MRPPPGRWGRRAERLEQLGVFEAPSSAYRWLRDSRDRGSTVSTACIANQRTLAGKQPEGHPVAALAEEWKRHDGDADRERAVGEQQQHGHPDLTGDAGRIGQEDRVW